MEFSDSIDQYRENMKIISLKEASLQPGRDQKRKLREKIDQLQGSLSALDKIAALEDQLSHLEHLTELDEIEMENFKRMTTRKGLYTLLEGMNAMAGKTNIISTFGKNIVDELYVTPLKLGEDRPIYQAEERTKGVLEYVIKSVEDWHPKVNNHRHQAIHSKDLPPVPISSTASSSNDPVVLPPRHVSLEEQHKQYTFYKPDEVVLEDQLDLSPPIPTQSNRPTSTPPPFPTQSTSTGIPTRPISTPPSFPTQSTSTTTTPPIPRPTQSTSTGTTRPTSAPRPIQSSSTNTTTSNNYRRPTTSPSPPPLNQYQPGFSNFYLNTQQQNYPNYLPNKEYEELASSYHSGAVFRGGCDEEEDDDDDKTTTKRNSKHDAGGFVLPSTNPNYIYPSTSTST